MDKIFEKLEDVHVRGAYIYVNASNAYADTAHTKQLTCSELVDLFVKGGVIVDSTVQYLPVSLKVVGGIATVTYVTTDTTTATTAKLATAKSKAD